MIHGGKTKAIIHIVHTVACAFSFVSESFHSKVLGFPLKHLGLSGHAT